METNTKNVTQVYQIWSYKLHISHQNSIVHHCMSLIVQVFQQNLLNEN